MTENNSKETKRETSESPVPSFTLQITKHDADTFLQASKELESTLQRVVASLPTASPADHKNSSLSPSSAAETNSGNNSTMQKKPLHELLYEAALQCKNPLIASILDREAAFKTPEHEAKVAFLLFHESDKTAKLRHYFHVLSSSPEGENDKDNTLDRSGLLSLFRSVLLSLSCCVHTPEQERMKNVVVEGKPESQSPDEPPRPTKRLKHGDETASTKPLSETDDGALPEIRDAAQSGSFDSSIATLRHEDEKESSNSSNSDKLRREIEEVAAYAADEVIGFARALDMDNHKVDLVMFGDWYNKTGRTIVPWLELLQPSKWKSQEHSSAKDVSAPSEQEESESPSSLLTEEPDSRAILSFDFSDPSSPTRVVVHISEDSIMALRHFVQRTGLVNRPPEDICRILSQISQDRKTISREVFQREYYRVIPSDVFEALSSDEKDAFREALLGYFSAFEDDFGSASHNSATQVDLKELALGFSFFCAGRKSTKLALGFDLLDTARTESLTEPQLLQFLQAYLAMLVTTSLLTPISKRQTHRAISRERQRLMQAAVHRGAKWTLGHFVKDVASNICDGQYSFDIFAQWYSLSGYNVAPWLELLDLQKLFALVSSEIPSPMRLPSFDRQHPQQRPGPTTTTTTARQTNKPRDRVSSLRRHHSSRRRGLPEILFTFPLANHRSLVVLKDDAVYVRDVVDQLGLLSVRPETLWEALALTVKTRRNKPKQADDAPEYVDMATFVQCVQEICPKLSRKRSNPGDSILQSALAEELLSNFFQCFDLSQMDRVAIDELMGGLSLLCGGKKSTKLAFAFSIFDTRPGSHDRKKKERFVHSLSGEDLFLFLRSILIVTFSCCRQSLDMSDEQVGRCIADTANMICNDVMRYQWETKQLDRLDFDEFGKWYNDGGFERAPWLELLDLGKWVLVDDYSTLETKNALPRVPPPALSSSILSPRPSSGLTPRPSALSPQPSGLTPRQSGLTPRGRDHVRFPDDPTVPPPPPEDALDTSFFDENAIMPMDSMDEMDMILMQPSMDKETDIQSPRISRSFSYPSPRQPQQQQKRKTTSLKFHLVTHENHGGYMLSVSTTRISHLRRIIIESGLHMLDAETVCNAILSKASRTKISKQSFDLAMKSLIPGLSGKKPLSEDMRTFSSLLSEVFTAFDAANTGRARAIEVACGFTVLCRGKKSDKLEFAFEVLDRNKNGRLSKVDTANYLQSFLTVLLSVATSPLLSSDRSDDTLTTIKGGGRFEFSPKILSRAVQAGAEWASGLAFSSLPDRKPSDTAGASMTFDDFAAWYTTAGYSSIPWLELLDLHKWVLA